MEEIRKVLEKPLKKINVKIDSIKYVNKELRIVLDSEDVIDLDRVVEATNIINPILDKYDFIKESYSLDVSSKEKGGEE